MNNSKKLYFGFTVYAILIALFAVLSFTGCGENGIQSPEFNHNQINPGANPPNGVQITIVRDTLAYGVYRITLTNNMHDTIVNDFHVQFQGGISITSQQGTPLGWSVDPNTTDFANGRIGWLTCTDPICQGGSANFLIRLNIPTRQEFWQLDWQATRDGITVFSGTGFNFRR